MIACHVVAGADSSSKISQMLGCTGERYLVQVQGQNAAAGEILA